MAVFGIASAAGSFVIYYIVQLCSQVVKGFSNTEMTDIVFLLTHVIENTDCELTLD